MHNFEIINFGSAKQVEDLPGRPPNMFNIKHSKRHTEKMMLL